MLGADRQAGGRPHPPGLAIVIPMLGRPQHITPLLASIRQATPDARILFVVSPHDRVVHAALDRAGVERITVPYQHVGDYARKINAGYRHTTEPMILTGASDLRFHPGWYEAALAKLTPGIGVVGTNDLGNPSVIAGEHATHFLVTREYADTHGTIDGPGAIMAEVYPHEYVDNELVGTARYRCAWAMAQDSYVEHLHPNWGKAPIDHIYARQRFRMATGRTIYNRRRPRWKG